MWEDTAPSTKLPHDFCAGIGPLQLGVVLVGNRFWKPLILLPNKTSARKKISGKNRIFDSKMGFWAKYFFD